MKKLYLFKFILLTHVLIFTNGFCSFHLWNISEIYSNSDGSIQFIELYTTAFGQDALSGQMLTADSDGNIIVFTIPNDVDLNTGNHSVLFATSAFPLLENSITPDFILPNNFFNKNASSISINFAGVDILNFTANDLSEDRTKSLKSDLTLSFNNPTNFAGEQTNLFNRLFLSSFEKQGCVAPLVLYADLDMDTFGNPDIQLVSCNVVNGYVDNNSDCDDTNSAINPVAFDNPDSSFVDSNCDGIDGNIDNAIFVSSSGDSGNSGTIISPLLTINSGIAMANSLGKQNVYIAIGTYNELVILENGVSIYGGYADTKFWKRVAVNSSVVSFDNMNVAGINNRVAISGMDISSETIIDSLNIATTNTLEAGGSNYGVRCVNCNGLIVRNNIVSVGNAANGSRGIDGIDGIDGINGNNGSDGCELPTICGAGGSSVSLFDPIAGLLNNSGQGGQGGQGNQMGSTGGSVDNVSAGIGGVGTEFCGTIGMSGSDGSNGSNGIDRTQGITGSGFTIFSGFWLGNPGEVGQIGGRGESGAGGGGSGGTGTTTTPSFPFSCNEQAGAGGGSGGTTGGIGSGGSGGQAGGSTFGIFLINSNLSLIQNNTISVGNPGLGGLGGRGGHGGHGGHGGIGGQDVSQIITGGRGGNAGDGGTGGDGGKGADGIAQLIFQQ